MHRSHGQGGYTLWELMLAMTIMLIVMAIAMRFMNDSVSISHTTREMTEAQQNLRTAHEFIARDLVAAGDGMEDIRSPRLLKTFLNNHLTKAPVGDTTYAALGVLGIVTSDNQAPNGTALPVPSPTPGTSIPVLTATDRLTIMMIDPDFNDDAGSIPLPSGNVTGNGQTVTIPGTVSMTQFSVGDIYFFTSTTASAFGSVTAINSAARTLTFAAGDRFGLNQVNANGPINLVANGRPSTLMRMEVVHYYIDSDKLLRRRVYGVGGVGGYTDTVVAEHIADLQFRYVLGQSDANGNVLAPVTALGTEAQQSLVRQVEVTVIAETAHNVVNGAKQKMTMTGTTTVRNMQFNTHLKMSN
ncbi:MAG: prepilin-type N-terminal cleavage/methylation domain-containing protein [Pyrinomonadaceae bacterium]